MRIRGQSLLGDLQRGDGLLSTHGRKCFKKVVQRIARLQVVYEIFNRHARSYKDRNSSQDFRVAVDNGFFTWHSLYLSAGVYRVRIDGANPAGRMHQIRLHFARLGRPVVADRQHGDFAFNKQFNRRYHLRRQFLHAATIAVEHKGKKRKWTASLPADPARTLKALEGSLR